MVAIVLLDNNQQHRAPPHFDKSAHLVVPIRTPMGRIALAVCQDGELTQRPDDQLHGFIETLRLGSAPRTAPLDDGGIS